MSRMRVNRVRTAVVCGAVVLGAVIYSTARSATLRVPQDYSSIAAAANVAQPGDSILVWRPPGGTYENQQISLRQGVVLRGMEQIYPSVQMSVHNSVISLLEETSIVGVDDTTRVEHLAIYNPPFHETIQVYTPRSSIVESYFWTAGPYDYTTVRIWKGGLVAGNYFSGTGESNAIEVRQGVNVVAWNFFDGLFFGLTLDNQGAPESATLSFRNNTILSCGGFFFRLRPDSNGEIVNNLFRSTDVVECSGSGPMDVRYNDFYLTGTSCPLGIGNISEDPLSCAGPPIDPHPHPWLEPESPCVGTGENGTNMGSGGICGVTSVGGHGSTPKRIRLTVEPNPVSSGAEFNFQGAMGNPTLEIFDAQGRLIDLLRPSGHRVRWNPSGSWSAGVYFARLRGAGVCETVKFLVIR